MAGLEDLVGQFGGLMAPQPQAQESQWSQMLQHPATQAALLSFGLQALSGGWGNGAQQFAQAAGAGAQGAGTYTGQEEARTRYEQQRQDQAAARAAERQTRLDVANIGAASRQEVAGITAANRAEIAALRREAAAGRTDDRMQIAQMQNRRAAEANLHTQRQRQLAELILVPANQRDAARAAIENRFNEDMARVARLYPVAGDAPAAATGGIPPASTGGNPAVAPAPATVAPRPTSAAPAPVTGGPAAANGPSALGSFFSALTQGSGGLQPPPAQAAPAGPAVQAPGAVPDTGAAYLNRLVARAMARDATAVTELRRLMEDPNTGAAATAAWRAARGAGVQ